MKDRIVLYTTGCPKCSVIERKLDAKGVQYTKNENVEEMIEKGFQEAPILEVNNKYLDFSEALRWIAGNVL